MAIERSLLDQITIPVPFFVVAVIVVLEPTFTFTNDALSVISGSGSDDDVLVLEDEVGCDEEEPLLLEVLFLNKEHPLSSRANIHAAGNNIFFIAIPLYLKTIEFV